MKTFTKTKLIPETEADVLSLRAGDVVHFYFTEPYGREVKAILNSEPKINIDDGPYEFTAWFEGEGNLGFNLHDIEKVIRWEER